MEKIIRGGFGQNLARRIGKLDPTSSGLMLALSSGGVGTNPGLLPIPVVGSIARSLADRGVGRNTQNLLNATRSGVSQYPTLLNTVSKALRSRSLEDLKILEMSPAQRAALANILMTIGAEETNRYASSP